MVASMAAMRMKRPWIRRRQDARVLFEFGPEVVIEFEIRKVRKAPIRKQIMEMRVVSQPCGFAGRPAVERPRMTVLPVFDG